MARAAKVPETYHFYIAALQRILPLIKKDDRIHTEDFAKARDAINTLTSILADASKEEPGHA